MYTGDWEKGESRTAHMIIGEVKRVELLPSKNGRITITFPALPQQGGGGARMGENAEKRANSVGAFFVTAIVFLMLAIQLDFLQAGLNEFNPFLTPIQQVYGVPTANHIVIKEDNHIFRMPPIGWEKLRAWKSP